MKNERLSDLRSCKLQYTRQYDEFVEVRTNSQSVYITIVYFALYSSSLCLDDNHI